MANSERHKQCNRRQPCVLVVTCRDFEDRSREGDAEKQERLSRFTGASAISSDAYFNRADPDGPGGSMGSGSRGMGSGGMGSGAQGQGQYGQDMDLTAAELVNRLSFHVSMSPMLAVWLTFQHSVPQLALGRGTGRGRTTNAVSLERCRNMCQRIGIVRGSMRLVLQLP